MTSPKLAKRKTLEGQAPLVIEALLAGQTEQSIANQFGATKRGVQLFKARHMDEMLGVKESAVEAVKHLWITDKVERTSILQELADMTLTELRTFGITTEKVTISEDGGPITTRDYRAAAVKELRGLLKDAAIEEGQIVTPKAGGDTFNIENAVLVRYIEGPSGNG